MGHVIRCSCRGDDLSCARCGGSGGLWARAATIIIDGLPPMRDEDDLCDLPWPEARAEFERRWWERHIEAHGKSGASAAIAGVTRSVLYKITRRNRL